MFVFAPVAQLDRASVFGTEGWEFEPLRAHLFANFDLLSAPEAPLDQILTNFAGLTTAASTARRLPSSITCGCLCIVWMCPHVMSLAWSACSYTTALRRAASRNHAALSLGVRF